MHELSAEYAMIVAIANLQGRILQSQNEEDRKKLRDLLSTCKYVAESLAKLAWEPSEDDCRRAHTVTTLGVTPFRG
jgi:hypothetical protein